MNVVNRFRRSWGTYTLTTIAGLAFAFGLLCLYEGVFGDKADWLPAASSSIAICGTMVALHSQARKDKVDRSRFYLDSALKSFKQATDMLSDNNDRVRWIAGARMLVRSHEIAESITEREHLAVLEINLDELRHTLGKILGSRDNTKTGAFFYGTANHNVSLDQAARSATAEQEIDSHHSMSRHDSIPEDVLYTIYSFAKFPDNYREPIASDQRFRGKEWRFLRFKYPGLFQYISHTDQHISLGGELHPNPKPPDRNGT